MTYVLHNVVQAFDLLYIIKLAIKDLSIDISIDTSPIRKVSD